MDLVISTIVTQIVILFILIFLGFFFGKKNLFSDLSISHMATFALYAVAPCAVIESFFREFQPQLLREMGAVALITAAAFLLSILLARLCIRHRDLRTQNVLQYGVVFSNCGYMGLPLLQALYGADGVLYGAVYIAVYNIMVWTYGVVQMSGDLHQVSARKLINPGTISVVIGLVLFLSSVTLPTVIREPISYLSALNVPLPMVICGYYLSKSHLRSVWKQPIYYLVIALRLLLIPLLTIVFLSRLSSLDSVLRCSCMVDIAAPSSVAMTMFANRYHQNEEAAANLVSATTLLSAFTLPLILVIAQVSFQ